MSDPSYPWENLQVYFENLKRQLGIPADEAKDRIFNDCRAGRLEIRALHAAAAGTFKKFQTAAYDQFRVETADGLFAADQFEVRQRLIVAEPGLLGPVTPMSDALRERFDARLRELGGAYVVSPSGSGFMMAPPLSSPSTSPAAPASDSQPEPSKPKPPKPEPAAARRRKVEREVTAYLMMKDDLETVDREHYWPETLKRFANRMPDFSKRGYYRALAATGRITFGPKLPDPRK